MSTKKYWVMTNVKINSTRKSHLRLLGVDRDRKRFADGTYLAELTETQAARLREEDLWVLGVNEDTGILERLDAEDDEMRAERKNYVSTLLASGKAVVAETDADLSRATHAIYGYSADGTPIVTRLRFN